MLWNRGKEGIVSQTARIYKREGGERLNIEREMTRVEKGGGRDAIRRTGETAVLAGKVHIKGRAIFVMRVDRQSVITIVQKIGFVGGIIRCHC